MFPASVGATGPLRRPGTTGQPDSVVAQSTVTNISRDMDSLSLAQDASAIVRAAPQKLSGSEKSSNNNSSSERRRRQIDDLDASVSSIDRGFAVRPGFGQHGRFINLISNYFPVRFDMNLIVYHYDIDINQLRRANNQGEFDEPIIPMDDVNSKRYKKMRAKINIQMIQKAVEENSGPGQLFEGIVPVFDGSRNLYAAKEIALIRDNPLKLHRIKVGIDVNGREEWYAFNIKLASHIDMSLLSRYFLREFMEPPHECFQALDIIMRYGPTYLGIPINQSLFIPENEDATRKTIGGGQEMAFGYYQSIHAVSSGSTLVVDRTCTIFHESGPVLAWAAKVLKLARPDDLKAIHFKGRSKYVLEDAIKNLEVKVNHLTYKRRYKIRGITDEAVKDIVIDYQEPDSDGNLVFVKKMSLVEFYGKQYNKSLKHVDYPCLITGSKTRPNYLPVELCDVVPDQPVKVMSAQATAEMIRASAQQKPHERIQVIQRSIALSKNQNKPYLSEFGIQIRNNPIKVTGRILDAPILKYQNGQVTPREGKWDIRSRTMVEPMSLSPQEWAVVCFEPRISREDIDALIRQFREKGKNVGMNIDQPAGVLRPAYQKGEIKTTFEKIKLRAEQLKLVVCIVYQNNDLYREIKLVGDCMKLIATQCIHAKNIPRKIRDELYINNVLLKINGKLGGVSSAIDLSSPRLSKFLRGERIMTIGIDFTHPSPGDALSTSICACVASLDSAQSTWVSSVRVNRGNAQVELVTGLDEMLMTILQAYADKNGYFPEQILIYRDGISEAQFQKVNSVEGKLIKRAIEDAIKSKPHIEAITPKISLVVVQKHHRTRFVPEFPAEGVGRGQNIPPGTVVDSDVIHTSDFDFYLASHEGLQGTSRPTHYYVLKDEIGFDADDLEETTNALTYCFVRCLKSISAPAPVAYANLVAYRARQHFLASQDKSHRFDYQSFSTQDLFKGRLYFI